MQMSRVLPAQDQGPVIPARLDSECSGSSPLSYPSALLYRPIPHKVQPCPASDSLAFALGSLSGTSERTPQHPTRAPIVFFTPSSIMPLVVVTRIRPRPGIVPTERIFTHISDQEARGYNTHSVLTVHIDRRGDAAMKRVGVMVEKSLLARGVTVHFLPIHQPTIGNRVRYIFATHPTLLLDADAPRGYEVVDYPGLFNLVFNGELQALAYARSSLHVHLSRFPLHAEKLNAELNRYPRLAANYLRLSALWERPAYGAIFRMAVAPEPARVPTSASSASRPEAPLPAGTIIARPSSPFAETMPGAWPSDVLPRPGGSSSAGIDIAAEPEAAPPVAHPRRNRGRAQLARPVPVSTKPSASIKCFPCGGKGKGDLEPRHAQNAMGKGVVASEMVADSSDDEGLIPARAPLRRRIKAEPDDGSYKRILRAIKHLDDSSSEEDFEVTGASLPSVRGADRKRKRDELN
ncbi:uncharacterized protein MKK02DRAFT_31468 [Dioszegia hungarica]|uniref:Uncharacterized protein n=1 Tax=Dioszegia hungarica TaxID=4972 RepID=A0AA38HFE0_9TREE|nr:uncharacterized protein MKK02DRAFT_31468 [Dioszegia hungarica]KAI9637929.1 hypothetical protein MKK02DRAFT_31468 [Dioszegia hungarica]